MKNNRADRRFMKKWVRTKMMPVALGACRNCSRKTITPCLEGTDIVIYCSDCKAEKTRVPFLSEADAKAAFDRGLATIPS